jgi:hypothetical protein
VVLQIHDVDPKNKYILFGLFNGYKYRKCSITRTGQRITSKSGKVAIFEIVSLQTVSYAQCVDTIVAVQVIKAYGKMKA